MFFPVCLEEGRSPSRIYKNARNELEILHAITSKTAHFISTLPKWLIQAHFLSINCITVSLFYPSRLYVFAQLMYCKFDCLKICVAITF